MKKYKIKCSKCLTLIFSKAKNKNKAICWNCKITTSKYKAKNCITCNKITKNPKFCSRTCSAKYNGIHFPKRKTNKKCTKCSKIVKSYRYSMCEKHHKKYIETRFDYIKELKLKDYWSKKSLSKLHSSSKNAHIRILARNHFKDLVNKPCKRCNYDKHVELCHIKPIREFNETAKIKEVNSYENLIQLCRNCHWEFDNNLITIEEILGLQPKSET